MGSIFSLDRLAISYELEETNCDFVKGVARNVKESNYLVCEIVPIWYPGRFIEDPRSWREMLRWFFFDVSRYSFFVLGVINASFWFSLPFSHKSLLQASSPDPYTLMILSPLLLFLFYTPVLEVYCTSSFLSWTDSLIRPAVPPLLALMLGRRIRISKWTGGEYSIDSRTESFCAERDKWCLTIEYSSLSFLLFRSLRQRKNWIRRDLSTLWDWEATHKISISIQIPDFSRDPYSTVSEGGRWGYGRFQNSTIWW